jgi:hypothetical protein
VVGRAKRRSHGKQPYVPQRPEGGLLPLAGPWDVFEHDNGERDYRFTIVPASPPGRPSVRTEDEARKWIKRAVKADPTPRQKIAILIAKGTVTFDVFGVPV